MDVFRAATRRGGRSEVCGPNKGEVWQEVLHELYPHLALNGCTPAKRTEYAGLLESSFAAYLADYEAYVTKGVLPSPESTEAGIPSSHVGSDGDKAGRNKATKKKKKEERVALPAKQLFVDSGAMHPLGSPRNSNRSDASNDALRTGAQLGANAAAEADLIISRAANKKRAVQSRVAVTYPHQRPHFHESQIPQPGTVAEDVDPQVGQAFFKYFPDWERCWPGVVESKLGRDVWRVRYSMREKSNGPLFSTIETVDRESLVMLLACGSTEEEATEAFDNGICQTCLRAHQGDEMLLCDGCNFGYHMQCLDPPIEAIPDGDWFCPVCMQEEEDEQRARFQSAGFATLSALASASNPAKVREYGYDDGREYTLEEFADEANRFREEYMERAAERGLELEGSSSRTGPDPLAERNLEREFWNLISQSRFREHLREQHEALCAQLDDSVEDDADSQILAPEGDAVHVTYGSDLDTGVLGSGFPTQSSVFNMRSRLHRGTLPHTALGTLHRAIQEAEPYVKDPWNLNILPTLEGSLLQYVEADITGVMVPWMYMGMLFSAFCWHTEDEYFSSISFNHWGAPKSWWGVPPSGADKFEAAARQIAPELFEVRPDVLTGIVTMFDPRELARRRVPICHLVQRPGEFVVTLPRAYHGGFNHGLNCAEAVNFATPAWLPFGAACVERYRALRQTPVIAYQALLCAVARNCVQKKESVLTAQRLYPFLVQTLDAERRAREELLRVPGLISRVESRGGEKSGTVVGPAAPLPPLPASGRARMKTPAFHNPPPLAGQAGGAPALVVGKMRKRHVDSTPPSFKRATRMAATSMSPGSHTGEHTTGALSKAADGDSMARMSRMTAHKRALMMGRILGLARMYGDIAQCFYCKTYCSLSHVRARVPGSGGQDADSDLGNGDETAEVITSCLEHAAQLAAELTGWRSSELILVETWSLAAFEALVQQVGERALDFRRWRERVRRVFQGEPQPDNVFANVGGTFEQHPSHDERKTWPADLGAVSVANVERARLEMATPAAEFCRALRARETLVRPPLPHLGELVALGSKLGLPENTDLAPLRELVAAGTALQMRALDLLSTQLDSSAPSASTATVTLSSFPSAASSSSPLRVRLAPGGSRFLGEGGGGDHHDSDDDDSGGPAGGSEGDSRSTGFSSSGPVENGENVATAAEREAEAANEIMARMSNVLDVLAEIKAFPVTLDTSIVRRAEGYVRGLEDWRAEALQLLQHPLYNLDSIIPPEVPLEELDEAQQALSEVLQTDSDASTERNVRAEGSAPDYFLQLRKKLPEYHALSVAHARLDWVLRARQALSSTGDDRLSVDEAQTLLQEAADVAPAQSEVEALATALQDVADWTSHASSLLRKGDLDSLLACVESSEDMVFRDELILREINAVTEARRSWLSRLENALSAALMPISDRAGRSVVGHRDSSDDARSESRRAASRAVELQELLLEGSKLGMSPDNPYVVSAKNLLQGVSDWVRMTRSLFGSPRRQQVSVSGSIAEALSELAERQDAARHLVSLSTKPTDLCCLCRRRPTQPPPEGDQTLVYSSTRGRGRVSNVFILGHEEVEQENHGDSAGHMGGKDAEPAPTQMIPCQTCSEWFHPWCVRFFSEHQATLAGPQVPRGAASSVEEGRFVCPSCAAKAAGYPLSDEKRICICRMPYVPHLQSLSVSCNDCLEQFHPRCVGVRTHAIAGLLRHGTDYKCESCCIARGLPYCTETGLHDFDAKRSSLKARLASLTRAGPIPVVELDNVEVLIKSARELPLDMDDEVRMMDDLAKPARELLRRVNQMRPLYRATERELWGAVEAHGSNSIKVSAETMRPLLFELWVRRLEDLFPPAYFDLSGRRKAQQSLETCRSLWMVAQVDGFERDVSGPHAAEWIRTVSFTKHGDSGPTAAAGSSGIPWVSSSAPGSSSMSTSRSSLPGFGAQYAPLLPLGSSSSSSSSSSSFSELASRSMVLNAPTSATADMVIPSANPKDISERLARRVQVVAECVKIGHADRVLRDVFRAAASASSQGQRLSDELCAQLAAASTALSGLSMTRTIRLRLKEVQAFADGSVDKVSFAYSRKRARMLVHEGSTGDAEDTPDTHEGGEGADDGGDADSTAG